MSSLNSLPPSLRNSIQKHSLLKVIAGLNNFDRDSVERIAVSAAHGGADLLDVACDPYLVEIAAKKSQLPICVSAVEPDLFKAAVSAGADMVEIGNFDSFYPQGRFFDASEVLSLTSHARELLPEVVLSVTVPHTLPLDQQAQLAIDLITEGADLIQTEGGTSARPFSPGVQGLIEKAAPTLAATEVIVKGLASAHLNAPVMCASGLSPVTIPMAIALGASGVGVGSIVSNLKDELAMVATVKALRASFVGNVSSRV